MAALFDFSNAFTTPIGLKIEQATNTDAINWGLNLEICDMVNEAQDGPEQAVKAMRKRFDQRKGMDTTLVLLDTLVKNCGRRLHLHIANRDFMCDLIKLVSPRDPTPQHIKDKVLTLIERWTDAFQNDQELAAVGEAYKYLKSQNVQFPAQNLDDMVSIHTPKASHTPVAAPAPMSGPAPPGPTPATPPEQGQGNDLARINKELLVVRGNDTVMNEILADVQASVTPRPDDLQLLKDLNTTCREMHRRLIQLLEQVMDEALVCQLLDLIDKLNNTFLRYDRYERALAEQQPPLQQPSSNYATPDLHPPDHDLLNLASDPVPSSTNPFAPARLPPVQHGNEDAENIYTTAPTRPPASSDDVLLAFDPVRDTTVDPVRDTTGQMSTLAVDDEFDMFAQNRSNTLNERVLASSSAEAYNDAHNVPSMSISGAMAARPHDTQDDWLTDLSATNQTGVMSSEEFDQFLNERAPDPPTHTPVRHQPKKDDDDLLAL